MKPQQKTPDKLLMLPVVVWAFTFTYSTVWLFILMNTGKDIAIYYVLMYCTFLVIGLNIAIISIVFIASYYYERYKNELQNRIFFMLTNIPVAAIYFILMCRFAKFFN
jgi:hypothetical protein